MAGARRWFWMPATPAGGAAPATADRSAPELVAVKASLCKIFKPHQILKLIERVDPRPGSLHLRLDAEALANGIEVSADRAVSKALTIEAPFRMCRRGVELKLHLGVVPMEVDQTLIQNIVKARHWLTMITESKTFTEIAETDSTSKRRIQAVVELAMLAPDVLDAIAAGEQPVGLTSDYLIKTGFSAIWTEQHEQFADL